MLQLLLFPNKRPRARQSPGRNFPRMLLLLAGLLAIGLPGRAEARELAYIAPPMKKSDAGLKEKIGDSALDKAGEYRRVLWVTRWDFANAEDIKKICYNAASARFTDILFQVRGEGTVFYKSDIEPWAWELSGEGPEGVGRNPGWDPLEVAVREGHRWGLRVHAYINTLPGWAQKVSPPKSSGQLWAAHKDWFMVDRDGDRMQPGGWYAFLDPGLPEVRSHLAKLAGELATNYKIDGIHLDYIRYPEEKGDYSYHPRVVANFKEQSGGTPSSKPAQWRQYRRDQVTATVKSISDAAREARPSIEISAAVIAEDQKREELCMQPALEWVRKGYIDAIAPMNYTGENALFANRCGSFAEFKDHVWMGVWAKPDRNANLNSQIRKVAAKGFGAVAVFSYGELFNNHRSTTRAKGVYETFVSKK